MRTRKSTPRLEDMFGTGKEAAMEIIFDSGLRTITIDNVADFFDDVDDSCGKFEFGHESIAERLFHTLTTISRARVAARKSSSR